MKRLSGFPAIVLATAAAGIIGYVIMWLVTQRAGAAGYAVFAVFWSAVYLVIGAASGVQQEITRATRPVSGPVQEHPRVARNFAIGGFATIVVAIVATSPIWIGPVFAGSWALVPPLAVAAGSYVFVAVLSGSLFGISSWGAVAALIALDAVLRLVLLGVLLIFTTDPVALAWGVAAPFPLTMLLLWPVVRGRIIGRSDIDVGYRQLTWNVVRTVVAAASVGLLVSGFPVLLRITSSDEPASSLGVIIFAITITRAPVIVSLMALQSFLIVRFRDAGSAFWRRLTSVCLLVLAVGAPVALAGWLWGPQVFAIVFGDSYRLDGWLIAVFVLSSVLVGLMTVVGSATLASNRHFAFSVGWLIAAGVTVVAMFLPFPFETRLVTAILVGPVSGLVFLFSALAFAPRPQDDGRPILEVDPS